VTDYYEVALLLGACFLVNYVTGDAKTNWVEGLVLVGLYVMIVRFFPSASAAPLPFASLSFLLTRHSS
jgi:Ca2+/H+ antiporter